MRDSISRMMVKSDSNPSPSFPNKVMYDGSKLSVLTYESTGSFVYVKSIAYDPISGALIITKSDGSVKNILGFLTSSSVSNMLKPKIGEKGKEGPPGEDGLDGRRGRQGSPGCPGVRGDQGLTGVRGDQGQIGDQGDQGDQGADGPMGPKGNKGFTGDTGPIGPRGFRGEDGPHGIIGLQGDPGVKGLKGVRGDQGCIGDQGLEGPKGMEGNQGPPGISGTPGESITPKGRDGKPGGVKDILGGNNVRAVWSGLNVVLSADCVKCPETPSTTTSSSTIPDCCNVEIIDGNANRIIDDDYDLYYGSFFLFNMPGSIDPSTRYTTCLPPGNITITCKNVKDNGAGTYKELTFKFLDGTTTEVKYSGQPTFNVNIKCPKDTSSTTISGTTGPTTSSCCNVEILDTNENGVIDDDWDVYLGSTKLFSMPGTVNPSTVYKACMPPGPVTLTFMMTKDNGFFTAKELVFKYNDGTSEKKLFGTGMTSMSVNVKCKT